MNEIGEGFLPEEASEKPPEINAEKMTRERFDAAVKANYSDFSHYAFKLMPRNPLDQADADVVVQEACLAAFRHLDEIREGEAGLKAYIKKIIANCVINRWRGRERKKRKGERVFSLSNGDPRDPLETQASREPSAFDRLALKDLEKIIEALPPIYREVVKLEAEEPDLSEEEKAKILSIGEGAYRTRLFRARRMLEEKGVRRQ